MVRVLPSRAQTAFLIDEWYVRTTADFSRQLSVGPEAALSLIIGQAITKMLAEEEHLHGELSEGKKVKLALMIASVITFEAGLITFV